MQAVAGDYNQVVEAVEKLNIKPDFIPFLSTAERQALLRLSSKPASGPLLGTFTLDVALRKNAYRQEVLGEPENDPVRARDLANAIFSSTQNNDRPATDRRSHFLSWALFQAHKHKLKLYVTMEEARATLQQWGETDDVGTLIPHLKRENAYTCLLLAAKQDAINKLWTGTIPLCSEYQVRDGENIDLDDVQISSLNTVLRSPASLLCGMGGTGKSTIIVRAARAVPANRVSVVCLAPTHKAKLNISSQLDDADVSVGTVQSYTMMLKRGEPIGPSFFVLDESSMLDVETFGDFASAVLENCAAWQLCLVGDAEQLPPIGRGECFRTAVRQNRSSGRLVQLEKCYRASFIPMFAFHLAVRNGTLPDGDGDVVDVVTLANDGLVFAELRRIVQAEGDSMTYIAWKNEHVDLINRWVQARATGTPAHGHTYNVDDRVVYVGTNKPKEMLTNALCGSVTKVTKASTSVVWDNGTNGVVPNRHLRLAYCLTVHKAQGSGFNRVCVACLSGAAMLTCLDRRWLYTAVSRARERLVVVCTPEAKTLVGRPTTNPVLSSLNFKSPRGVKGGPVLVHQQSRPPRCLTSSSSPGISRTGR